MSALTLFSIVYGEAYVNFFERGCFASLMWPKNHAALLESNAVWDVWTSPGNEARFAAMAERLGLQLRLHAVLNLSDTKQVNLYGSLRGQMKLCVEQNCPMLFAGAMVIFGDGSIKSLIEIGAGDGICVAAPTLHVNEPGFVDAMGPGPLSNAQLVKLSFDRMHQTFKDSEATLPQTNSDVSGMSWRKIGKDLYSVTYRLPSQWFMRPRIEDIKWWGDHPKFGFFDHRFPETLVAAQRQRVVGSSDAVFIAELSDPRRGIAPLTNTPAGEPDRYYTTDPNRVLAHNKVNRNVAVIWRAE